MTTLLTGKEEISYLIRRVIEKFEYTNDQKMICNTNRENYVAVARELSTISNELPYTSKEKEHQEYTEIPVQERQMHYPQRKYDITGGQIKDVYFGLVKKPRPHLIDACYIYLYGVGRVGFAKNPVDPTLLVGEENMDDFSASTLQSPHYRWQLSAFLFLLVVLLLLGGIYMYFSQQSAADSKMWTSYQPSEEEINQITGIWMYQTGAPQTRANEAQRYRRVATNMVSIQLVNGILEIERHGATINHQGYLEFTSPGILSIHSFVERKADGSLVNPSHSLARLSPEDSVMYAISSTWSFESDDNNDVIGARNLYRKLGTGGTLRLISNTPENAACHCKIIEWDKDDGTIERFNLTYEAIKEGSVEEHLNESSLILRKPKDGVLLSAP